MRNNRIANERRLRVSAVVNEILSGGVSTAGLPPIVVIECPFRHVRQGRAVRLVVGDTSLTTDASRKAILKAIARARCWYEQITTGQASSIEELAGMHGVSPRFIHKRMKLVPLSPQSVEGFMTRPEWMPISLDDLLTAVPMNWRETKVRSVGQIHITRKQFFLGFWPASYSHRKVKFLQLH